MSGAASLKGGAPRGAPAVRPASGVDLIRSARANAGGFLTSAAVDGIAADPATRLVPLLVRCGGCRFTAPAQDVAHLVAIITHEGTDYVRDVSLPVGA